MPQNSNAGEFDVTIGNAIKAPYFIYGIHSDFEWEDSIRDYPAPWAEFEIPGEIVFTVASSYIRYEGFHTYKTWPIWFTFILPKYILS